MNQNRRSFLKSSGAFAACMGLGPFETLVRFEAGRGGLPRAARKKTLVVVFLRGGIDGLNLVVPYADEGYYRLRNYIAVQRPGQPNGALDLDGRFGLHPWAEPLLPHFQAGRAVALHAVGYESNTRSHFEEQDVWETGILANTIRSDGWLNRHLAATAGDGPIRAVAVGDALPRILRGEAQALAIRNLSDLSLGSRGDASVASVLQRAYGSRSAGDEARGLLDAGGTATIEALREFQKVAEAAYTPGVEYPQTELAGRLQEVVRLIKADVGLEVAVLDYGGWDTHQNQGGIGGTYSQLVRQLSGALDAFARDLGDDLDDVVLLTLSEFGRTAAQNGTGGTDHGWGNCLLALGGPVLRAGNGKPRHVIGEWPGLGPDELNQGRDLRHTTDFRDVFCEVGSQHLGTPDVAALVPDHEPQSVGLV